MRNVDVAKSLLTQSARRLETAKRELNEGSLAYSIRSSQEAVELALKAALRLLGIEYPKRHDVSPALIKFRDRFPAWFPVDEMADVSRKLAEKREPAMYGDELSMTPADLVFDKSEAEEAFNSAEQAYKAVKKLFAEYSG
ncbi:MAG: HEPN domain-containing protein [Nitrososphaerota archaeon]|nr:HEPN domain-containing protein [Candidatus Calditenuaceae archaeon]MDW8073914.1 HEPN domain-containing protein [Nitrososphaerota archaeon]